MPQFQSLESWTTSLSMEQAMERTLEAMKENGVTVTEQTATYVLGIQGSELKIRIMGGRFAKGASLPKRMSVALEEGQPGTTVHANVEEFLSAGLVDPKFAERYKAYFAEWMKILRGALPA